MREAEIERDHPAGMGGTQKLFRFKNGYGASVIHSPFSYGHEEGKWELAVIRYMKEGESSYEIIYDTPITDDVIGHLSEQEVDEILTQIEVL